MNASYTQFVAREGADDEELLATGYNQALIVPVGTTVYVEGERYASLGSTVHIDGQRIAVIVNLEEASRV